MTQIELHKKIDELVLKNPTDVKKEEVLGLIPKDNLDGWQYFYAKADERWLDWLWGNGFLDKIKEKSEDVTQFGGQRFPELDYLVKVAEKVPDKVVEIMLKVEVSKEHFNPGVLNRFIWICNTLPPKELALIIPKIKKENWVQLMHAFNSFGFEYERMFKILKDAGDYENLLKLADIVLTVRNKKDFKRRYAETKSGVKIPVGDDKSFYFNDLSHTKVFEYLTGVDVEYTERALALATKTMSEVIELGDKAELRDKAVFPIQETLHLHDIDFFTLELDDKERLSYRDDVRNLAAVIKKLIAQLIDEKRENGKETEAREIFEKYIDTLPDSMAMWRLRLFVMSLYPDAFKDELKKSFFRLFDVMDEGKSYYEIISGAEYEKALRKGFSAVLSREERKEYIEKVIEYFKKKDDEKKIKKENWHLTYGSRILTVIKDEIEKNEELIKLFEEAKKKGFKFIDNYKSEPSIKMSGFASSIMSKGPISQEEFDRKPVDEILELLREDWTPEKLNEQNENKDFHRPRNVEGAGNLLQTGVGARFEEFIGNSKKFFDEQEIDAHYTHAFLRGTQKAIKSGKRVNDDEWLPFIKLLKSLIDAKLKNKEREEGFYDTWIADWKAVYYVIPDILQELLSEKDGQVAVGDFEKYRDDFLDILAFLLQYPDPKPEDEKTETAKSKISFPGDSEFLVSDPYSIAINSVRGRAFQAFLMFVYQDGKELEKKEVKIKEDVISLYEEIIRGENTRTMMFMHGHHLPTFYFRNKKWTKEFLIPQIFVEKKDEFLRLASVEGYLTQTLYKEIFDDSDFKELYKEWIKLENTKYPNQKHFKDVDEALAIHMALAFTNFGIDVDKKTGFEDVLLKKFWETKNSNNQTRHQEFISFIGRTVLTTDRAGDDFLEKNQIIEKKLIKFWDWALKNIDDKKVLSGFGYWINPNKEVLDDKKVVEKMATTLENSSGELDWEYGLMQRLPKFAEKDPKNTLSIIENYLLGENEELNQKRRASMFEIDKEIKEALEVIYQKDKLKVDVENLINMLIEKGSSMFWGLKDVLK